MILPESKTVLVEHSNKKVYDLGDKIAKVFNANKPASDVFNEALNLARISESGIRTPKPLEMCIRDSGLEGNPDGATECGGDARSIDGLSGIA